MVVVENICNFFILTLPPGFTQDHVRKAIKARMPITYFKYLNFGFIIAPNHEQQPMCHLCKKAFSIAAMKPSRPSDHLNKIHLDKAKENLPYIKTQRHKFRNRKSIHYLMKNQAQKCDNGVLCSYNIFKMIAR